MREAKHRVGLATGIALVLVGGLAVWGYHHLSNAVGSQPSVLTASAGSCAKTAKARSAEADAVGVESGAADGSQRGADPLEVVIFFSSECDECRIIRTQVIPQLQAAFGDAVVIRQYDTATLAGYRKLAEYERRFGSNEDSAAKLFAGGLSLIGTMAIVGSSFGLVAGLLGQSEPPQIVLQGNGHVTEPLVKEKKP